VIQHNENDQLVLSGRAFLPLPARLIKEPDIERQVEVWTHSLSREVPRGVDINVTARLLVLDLAREFAAKWIGSQRN
jgi:hypothetical protein